MRSRKAGVQRLPAGWASFDLSQWLEILRLASPFTKHSKHRERQHRQQLATPTTTYALETAATATYALETAASGSRIVV